MTMRYDLMGNHHNLQDPTVVWRMPVAPGTSIKNCSVDLTYRSDVFTSATLNPMLYSIYFVYCPYRLLWDDWVRFIAQDDDFAGTLPLTTNNWSRVMDVAAAKRPTSNHSAFARRAFKLFYNQYLGDEDLGSFYADITTDTDTADHEMKNVDQFIARLRDGDDIDSPTFDATTTPIDLNQFAFEMAQARSRRKAQISGDKYVDALARMGVSLDWRVQNAPELLGKMHMTIRPNFVIATDGTNLGNSRIRFYGKFSTGFGNKRFAEEGLVFAVAGVRTQFSNTSYGGPLDGTLQSIDDFYLGDDPRIMQGFDSSIVCEETPGTGEVFTRRHARYLDGVHFIPADDALDYFAASTLSTPEQAIYTPLNLAQSGEITSDFNTMVEVTTNLRSPVNQGY